MAAPPPTTRLPAWLRIASWPVGGVLLFVFFVFLGFPYDLLALRLGSQIEAATRARVRIGDVSPHLGLAGPGLAASQVLVSPERGGTIAVERLVLRPAWSTAWFRGTPALHLDLKSDIGTAAGTLTLGDTGGWEGELEAVRLEYLPLEMLESFQIQGVLDADVDLHNAGDEAGGGLVGRVDFELREGSLGAEALPVAVPFDRLYGQLHFGGETYLTVSGVKLEGPMIAGNVEGTIGSGPSPERRPLAMKIVYEVQDPNLAGMLASFGKRGPEGASQIAVSGTLARPVVR
jgi:type II secretion system protein N